MLPLHPQLRNQLERTVIAARAVAERGAGDALRALGVEAERAPDHLDEEARARRVKLRAELKRLGSFADLRAEVAYETWHKMLFARFLLRNDLLRYQGFAVAPDDLNDAEVQAELGARTPDELEVALATAMLPGLFDGRDPAWKFELPAETRGDLLKLLGELPPETFAADDALGWVYQYWQTARKADVNAAGGRVEARDVPAVTQLFTEPYMVEWLLDQTLGKLDDAALSRVSLLDPCCGSGHFLVAAFARVFEARQRVEGETDAQAARAVLEQNLAGLELDARCVQLAGFALLLSAWKRGGFDASLRPRVACSGLEASGGVGQWTRGAGSDGNLSNALWQLFHLFQKAPVYGSLIDARQNDAFKSVVGWDELEPKLLEALEAGAPGGEDPVEAIFGMGARGLVRAARLLAGHYDVVATNVPYLARGKHNPELAAFCAQEYPHAKADLATVFLQRALKWLRPGGVLALVTPQNWLFLGSYAQLRQQLLRQITWKSVARLGAGAFSTISGEVVNVALMSLENRAPEAGTVFGGVDVSGHKTPAEKARALAEQTPVEVSQEAQLRNPDARITFEDMGSGELLEKYATSNKGITSNDDPFFLRKFWEVPEIKDGWEKHLSTVNEIQLYGGCEHILLYENGVGRLRELAASQERDRGRDKQGKNAWGKIGVAVSCMRDLPVALYEGTKFDTNVATIVPKNPEHLAAIWCFCSSPQFNVAVRRIDQKLSVTNKTLVKVPFDLAHWSAIAAQRYPAGLPSPRSDDPTQWLFDGAIASARRHSAHATLQVALARLLGYQWPMQAPATDSQHAATDSQHAATDSQHAATDSQHAATDSQHAATDSQHAATDSQHAATDSQHAATDSQHAATDSQHAATDSQHAATDSQHESLGRGQADLSGFFDRDGIVCVPACNGELEAAARLRALLFAALPDQPNLIETLLEEVGWGGHTLESWLRDGFWKAHCRMFGNRPFVWQIWDGHAAGFAAFVNAHTLDRLKLDKLIYSYLGDYLAQTEAASARQEPGAPARLVAARALKIKLEHIAGGEEPFDIYVRWKPLAGQPIGWEPDANDGIRVNIRPWVEAEVLRGKFTINWNKDRGRNPDGGERENDVHLSLAEKRAARTP